MNTANLKNILPEIFGENLVRGRGLFARSVMKSQMASPGFTSVYAAMVAVVNTKFPELGELVLRRAILQVRAAGDGRAVDVRCPYAESGSLHFKGFKCIDPPSPPSPPGIQAPSGEGRPCVVKAVNQVLPSPVHSRGGATATVRHAYPRPRHLCACR